MKRLLTIAALLLLVGCGGQVHVSDHTGKPLQNAMIVPVNDAGNGSATNGSAIRTDATQVTCAVDLRNLPAQKLYARFGFKASGMTIMRLNFTDEG